ncbi:hypothetical protein OJF2_17720 [Aquisphaera giovannonii]|uniref:Tetratricopeptide repeat protein n=1 Tax=Aquisphaera giovannonii TaxID=406548 RepID=A0A5B9VZ61_9BACT|nr:hypothetical protein [Aquisphaera giovannonii]QEH33271.1 hypothetical protein OJF2_17720 [Aquisphaera giovannonii]
MPEPQATPPAPESEEVQPGAIAEQDPAATQAPEATESIPEPEPWTPERVLEWNAYYDIYVMLAALLLAFVGSAVRVDAKNSALWTHLKAGELIAAEGSPALGNVFSYSEPDAPWVDVSWLFEWSHSALYRLVRDNVPVDPTDPTANLASADQIGIGCLIALSALVRVATAWVLLKVRRPGPGLWWSAICTAVALGVLIGPGSGSFVGFIPGGIAGSGVVAPATWGALLLAIEMLILHRAFGQGRGRTLYGLVPLFALWANVDDSFLMGLMILAAAVVGRLIDGTASESLVLSPAEESSTSEDTDAGRRRPAATSAALLVLGLCVLACLVNPFTYKAYLAAGSPFGRIFSGSEVTRVGEISFFGSQIRKIYKAEWYWFTVFYLTMVCLGLGTFLLNARRFSWARFLPFAAASTVWALFMGQQQVYAVVFAAVASASGQEWYLGRFGSRGRIGSGWNAWSTGGRLVTLAVMFFLVAVSITGWLIVPGQPRFGFSYDPGEFAFEAAEYLARKDAPPGNVLNTTAAQGDALIWKAYPGRKTFYDDRTNVFSRGLYEEQRTLRQALRDDDEATWKPTLDRLRVNTVMIDADGAPDTIRRLSHSPRWIPYYDDGHTMLFGRADAPEAERKAFEDSRLDAPLRAFRISAPVPPADRPPTPTSWIDRYFRNRLLGQAEPHTSAAVRWLQGVGADPEEAATPDPARCLLAVREARKALARNPDDWVAYRLLNLAYRLLAAQETAILGGIPMTAENLPRINMLVPDYSLLGLRYQQRATALNYAIQTSPPPTTADERRELNQLTFELFQLYGQAGYIDLARDRLQMLLETSQPGDLSEDVRGSYERQLAELSERVQQIEENILNLQVERSAGPVEKAMYAREQGAVGHAISELEEAYHQNMSPIVVKPMLVDLYCTTGQPDRAMELISLAAGDDQTLGTEPGDSYRRQGLIYLLLGNYGSAASFWQDRAIPRLRYERTSRALMTAQAVTRGDLANASNADLTLAGLLGRQSLWDFELGQCLLESGAPDRAAESYTRSLTVEPASPYRPLMAYYLEQMGRPVPAATKATTTPAAPGSQSPAAPDGKPEPPKPAAAEPGASKPADPAKSEATKPAEPAKVDATRPDPAKPAENGTTEPAKAETKPGGGDPARANPAEPAKPKS